MFSATVVTAVLLVVLFIWTLAAVTTLPVSPVILSAIFDVQFPIDDRCFCFDHIVDCSSRGKTELWPADICDANPKVLDISWNALNSSGHLCQAFEDVNVVCGLPTLFLDDLQVFRVHGNQLIQFSGHGDAYPNLRILDLSLNRISKVLLLLLDELEVLDFSFNNLTTVPWSDIQMSIPNIKELDLSHNFISLEGSDEFRFAYKLQCLNLSRNNISEFHQHGTDDLHNLQTLDLSKNPLNIIYYGFSSFRNLKYLNLSEANIYGLWEETFYCLDSLQILDISHNHLMYLPKGMFRHAMHLQYLDLSHNDISVAEFTDIGEELDTFWRCHINNSETPLFRSFGSLLELDLSYNKLEGIKSSTFSALRALRALNLSNNALSYFVKDAFLALKELVTVDLSHNLITSLPPGGFAGSKNLICLDISKNLLMSLGDGEAFLGLGGLRELDVSWNFIAELMEGTLVPLAQLERLDISWNVLRRAPGAAFHTLKALRYLNVSYNQLRSVPAELMRNCHIEVSYEGNEVVAPLLTCSPQDALLLYAQLERAMYWPTAFLPPLPWAVCLAAAIVFAAVLNRRVARMPTRTAAPPGS